MTPAHRVVAPDSSSSKAPFIDSEPPKPPTTRSQEIGKAVGAEFLVEIGGLLPRHLEARHVEQQADGHDAAHGADFGAALGDHAPIDVVAA